MANMGWYDPSPAKPIAPPPSPIPTGKGSRSAANSALANHLSTHIPKLSLPHRILPRRPAPAEIDFGSLLRREPDTVNRVLISARESGMFRIMGHGIYVDGVRSDLTEYCSVAVSRSEEFEGSPSAELVAKQARVLGIRQKQPSFSQNIKNIQNGLERIAGELAQVLYENSNKQIMSKGVKIINSVLKVHRSNQGLLVDENQLIADEIINQPCRDYALSLHLALEQSEFHVHSKQGDMLMSVDSGLIIVTLGKELESWSNEEFKSTHGELISEKNFSIGRSIFSIEIECSTSISSLGEIEINKTISVLDQIVLMIVVLILYKMLLFILYSF